MATLILALLLSCRDDGADGADGVDGAAGAAGADGAAGVDGADGADGIDADRPLSALVALSLSGDDDTGATNVAELVRARVDQLATGTLSDTVEFPLANAGTDSLRAIAGLQVGLVISWLEPLTFDDELDSPRFGTNNDFTGWFGDGWDDDPTAPPQWNGSDSHGWLWVNHETFSDSFPSATRAPTGQHLTYAAWLRSRGLLDNDVESATWSTEDLDTYRAATRSQIGGSWMRLLRDPSSGDWEVDRSADNRRYDHGPSTLMTVSGHSLLSGLDHDDLGVALAEGVVSGTYGNCSGAVTPWGTVLSGEENTQLAYGDAEPCWTWDNGFVLGQGFDPGADIAPVLSADPDSHYGAISDANLHHARDIHGFLAEFDPGEAPTAYLGSAGAGLGHRKLGAMGRARWENAAVVVDADGRLVDGQPIVLYGGDDRRGGRVYKFVTRLPFATGMSKAAIRDLLDDGSLYVAHFEGLDNATGRTLVSTGQLPTEIAPGTGRWIRLSVDSVDIAPNAAALGAPGTPVGVALKDVDWNSMGGFPDDDHVRSFLWTASNKLGVFETNRPEDLEWNADDPSGSPRLYIAFSNHSYKVALDAQGLLYDPTLHATEAPTRNDRTGSIFAIVEADPAAPADATTFAFFAVWSGSVGVGDYAASCPDNLMLDADGGLWFGTDGNYATSGTSEALYYLDLDPDHRALDTGIVTVTYGKAFRIAAMPSDAEATGPSMSSGMSTIFLSVQHPGVTAYSAWPE